MFEDEIYEISVDIHDFFIMYTTTKKSILSKLEHGTEINLKLHILIKIKWDINLQQI